MSASPNDPLYLSGAQWNLAPGRNSINAVGAWNLGYTGAGIKTAFIDDGFNYTNPDLTNYSSTLSYNVMTGGTDAFAADTHGTGTMGMLGAAANGVGMVGVAYDATLIGVQLALSSATKAQFGQAVDYASSTADVTSMSFTFAPWADRGFLDFKFYQNVTFGRSNLGTVYVVGAGNGRAAGDDINLHGLQNSQYVITVGSTDINGHVSAFSTPGVALHVVAPGERVVTTVADSTGVVSGTSYVAPTVAGIADLILQANGNLGWRDVQEIIGITAHKTAATDAVYLTNHAHDWNGGGMHHSADYGFGMVDAAAAVRLAEAFISNPYDKAYPGITHTVGSTLGADYSDSVSFSSNIRVEKAMVTVNLSNFDWSDYRISLVSGAGTESVLIDHPLANTFGSKVATFTTEQFWGEESNGNWTLKIHDYNTGTTSTLNSWSLRLVGDDAGRDNQYLFTDELAGLVKADPSRGVLADSNDGYDTLNFSATSGDLKMDLINGGSFRDPDGNTVSLTFKAGSTFENLFGGAGNDILGGNSGNNFIRGGYGYDTMSGSGGDDVFIEGRNSGADVISDFGTGDKIWLTDGVKLASASGNVAVLSDGATVTAANGYLWKSGDFVVVTGSWVQNLPHLDTLYA
ncbi:S8 family serine peptidase [Paracraurococcus lichenis]|uniref:S8 family serine peptidase n=1 Tax=Paracraurococcus lichenis TaxID=3064888 RepID=A0ABT9EA18_9PROT|nr:S8 family serine peptidase [Paracraurococcus sp. LOR1-02]MDO9713047.1 S8 family serine peptidase [Paracraurococcus sp. LOR1-02]